MIGTLSEPKTVAEVVEENRETFEIVADGDDEPAEWARAALQEVRDGE